MEHVAVIMLVCSWRLGGGRLTHEQQQQQRLHDERQCHCRPRGSSSHIDDELGS